MTYDEVYTRDRMFGDYLMDEVGLIIGQYPMQYSLYADRREETDLFTNGSKWAVRIRDKEAHDKWPYDVSIRLVGAHGNMAEFDKIMMGEGQYMFYGFMNMTRWQFEQWRANNGIVSGDPHLLDWAILDLSAFRKFFQTMNPEDSKALLDKWTYQHPAPDNVKVIYADRRIIPNFVLTTASDWMPKVMPTWVRKYETIQP